MGQESLMKKFSDLLFPLKWWVITHPFKAKEAMRISESARETAQSHLDDPDLDGDHAGGQIDAFRHVFWMSSLAQKIGERRARSLGEAYERANKIEHKKKLLEEGYLPDFVSSEMDLYNNEIGFQLAKEKPDASKEDLIRLSKQTVLSGNAKIIKKNKRGQFLDSQGKVIPREDYFDKWFSPKTLVPSDFLRPD